MKSKKSVKIASALSACLFFNSINTKTFSISFQDWFYISKIVKSIGSLLTDIALISRNFKVGMNNLSGGDICNFRRDLTPYTFVRQDDTSFFDVVSSCVIGVKNQIDMLKKIGKIYVYKRNYMNLYGRTIFNNEKNTHNNIGILMSGPSGCGKSYLATIFAHTLVADGFNEDGSINRNCKSVYRLSSANIDTSSKEPVWSQLLSERKMVQQGATIANNSFKAYIQANPNGGVIIFDEFEKVYNPSLGEGFRNIIEHGKIELDGTTYDMSNYVFIATTNASPSSMEATSTVAPLTEEEEAYGYTQCKFDKSLLNRFYLVKFPPLSTAALYTIFHNCVKSWNEAYSDSRVKLEVPIDVAAKIGIYLKNTHKGGREAGNLFDTLIPYLSDIESEIDRYTPKDETKEAVIKVEFNEEKCECFLSDVSERQLPERVN